MYPKQDLIRLANAKAALRNNIALHRERCAGAAASAVRPVELVDRALAYWRQFSPMMQLAAVPLGVVVTRALFPRYKILRKLVRWSPVVIAVARAVGSAAGSRAARRPVQAPEGRSASSPAR